MTGENRCPHCGSELPADAPEGLCPRCLLGAGLGNIAEKTAHAPAIEGPGTKIGRYELLELIGEGGMGLVYLAEQKEPIQRRVALKIVKLAMDTMQVVARFRAEQQTLAMLDHPNIAQVFDAGTTDSGRPYFVMEYVEGVPITKYCDRQKLSIDERLHLFLQVCAAIQHAHQKGVLHRDIKPSNILVSANDHAPLPKVIDFGIAKAVHQPLTEQTSITEQGQLLGTPEYMSPEQADMAYSEVDTRSDVYSLGVVLYELLAGAPPFEGETLRKRGVEHIRQTIRDEEPKTPSARLTALGEQAKEVALMRRTQLLTLARRLKRELEWIPLKAMHKEREERYQSVSELAQDISNYLDGAALLAGPQSRIYRTRKFIRKHAGSVTMAALVAVAIILGLVASILMGCRAEQARREETAARQQVEQALVRAEQAERIAQEERKKSEQLAESYRKALYFNRIALADVAYHNNNVRRLCELLDSCPEDLRGWEWNRLNYISDMSSMTLRGHTDPVWSVAVSPDGKWIASSGSFDKTVKVWDTESGTELMTLGGHEDTVGPVSFSPDGSRIISGSMDTTVRVWDSTSGEELMCLRGHEGATGARFSPDGKRIVSGSFDKTVKVWDAESGAELMTLRGHEGKVGVVTFSPNGKRIASGSFDETIKVWDVATGAEMMTLRGHKAFVSAVIFDPDGKRIVTSSKDSTIKVWDAATGAELMTIRGHKDRVQSVAFSPDGRRIVSAGRDSTIKVWDAQSGDEIRTLHGHEGIVYSVAFSPDGKRIVSGSSDMTIKVWGDVTVNHERMDFGDRARGVSFSPDGKRILSGNGTITVWDRSSGTELMTFRGSEGGSLVPRFSPDGKRIFSCQYKMMKVWEAATGAEVMTLRRPEGWFLATFSPNGKRIASWSVDEEWDDCGDTIELLDAATGDKLTTLYGHKIISAAFSPDGDRIVSGGDDGTITVWDAETGEETMSRKHEGGVSGILFSPDGMQIVSVGWDETVKLWDAASGAELVTLRYTQRASSVAFSPDGKRIVLGGDMVKIWDVATGTEVMTLRDPVDAGWVCFSPNGKTIACGGPSGITLLESEVPDEGFEPRRTGAAAKTLVDELYEEYGFYEEVINKLNTDKTLAEPVRKVALQIANSRKWEDAEKLKNEVWETVSSADKNIEAYLTALEKAEKANGWEPNDPAILRTFAAAQYRTGAYEEALQTLKRAEKLRADEGDEPDPSDLVFAAMALHQLSRGDEAEATLEHLRTLLRDERFVDDEEAKALLGEAEGLIEGERP